MRDYNPVSRPIKARNFIEMQNKEDYKEANIKAYQCLIGKLMYLSYKTQLDILFVVGQQDRCNADPRIGYLKAVKRIV